MISKEIRGIIEIKMKQLPLEKIIEIYNDAFDGRREIYPIEELGEKYSPIILIQLGMGVARMKSGETFGDVTWVDDYFSDEDYLDLHDDKSLRQTLLSDEALTRLLTAKPVQIINNMIERA